MVKALWRRHPAEDVLLEMLEGTAATETKDHVSRCETCRARIAVAEEGLLDSRHAEVPEPPPVYWDAFRRRVGQQIEETEAAALGGRHWWWPAVAAVAVVLVAVAGPRLSPRLVPVTPATLSGPPVPAWSALPPAAEDTGLGVLSGLESADLGSTAECRDAADCVAGLSDDESRALAEALRGEIRGGVL